MIWRDLIEEKKVFKKNIYHVNAKQNDVLPFFLKKKQKKVPFLRFKLISFSLINVLLSFDSFLFSLEHTKTLYHTLTRCSLF